MLPEGFCIYRTLTKISTSIFFIVITDFDQKLKDFYFKKIKQCTKSFMDLKNKAKKLSTELLILKVSVLLSFPKHIRR